MNESIALNLLTPLKTNKAQGRETKGQDEGFVLLTRAWRETSLMVECFTLNGGRRLMLARGARRPQSVLRGQLLPFHRLLWHWRGTGEVVNVSRVEWQGKIVFMPRQCLLSAHYLNELIHRLLPVADPHPLLYQCYAQTMSAFAESRVDSMASYKVYIEACLRRFEVVLLQEIGYGLRLDETAEEGECSPIQADEFYGYQAGLGLIPWNKIGTSMKLEDRIMGDSLIEMRTWLQSLVMDYPPFSIEVNDEVALRRLSEQKKLLRRLLQEALHHQPLNSRKVFHQIQRLQNITQY